MYYMKTRIKLSMALIAVGALSLPVSASACDMHGGYFNPMSGAKWKAYNPRVSYMDPALEANGDLDIAVPAARPERGKPQFSFVAKRASEKAMATRATTKSAEKSEPRDKPAEASMSKASLETDR
jgi:hypothetical protein